MIISLHTVCAILKRHDEQQHNRESRRGVRGTLVVSWFFVFALHVVVLTEKRHCNGTLHCSQQ